MASKKKNEKIMSLLSSEVEQLEKTKLKLTLTITPERFREGLKFAYDRNKNYFSIPGFRKGKAPRKIIEQAYGPEIFYDDAINYILPDAYEEALDKHDIEPVYRPEIDPGDISEKEGATFYATVFTRPEAEIGEYTGLTYPKEDTEPTEEDIQNALKAEQEKNSRMISVDRAAEMGDVVTINFEGFIDDEPFDGGKGEDHDLTLGSNQFIPGFEEQLVGHLPGDDVSVNVTFPDEYHSEEFAGKAAIFEVEVLDVKANELPEINDEFAEDVSEFDTLDEWKEDLKTKIKEQKEANVKGNMRVHLIKILVENSTMDVPEAMYLGRLDDMYEDFSRQINMRGMNIENYMRFTQTSEESLKASWRNQAEEDINGALALEAIVKKESFTLEEGAFDEHVKEMTGKEGDELTEIIDNLPPGRRKDIERTLLCEKALELVIEKAVAVDAPPEDKTEE